MNQERKEFIRKKVLLGENFLIMVGILLISISNHIFGFGVLERMDKNKNIFNITSFLLILFIILGIVSICIGVSRRYRIEDWKAIIKDLLIFGVIYLVIQIIVGLIVGGIARVFQGFMDGETVKSIISMIVKVLQVPIRTGAIIYIISLLSKKDIMNEKSYLHGIIIYIGYSLIQLLLGFLGQDGFFIVLRILISTMLTVLLWLGMEHYSVEKRGRK